MRFAPRRRAAPACCDCDPNKPHPGRPRINREQWAGSTRRVWDYDPLQGFAWFKLYDECGQADDCDENESIVYLEWAGSGDGKDYVRLTRTTLRPPLRPQLQPQRP